MKVAIIGSRGITNVDMKKYIPPNTTEIISGGARGSEIRLQNNMRKKII